jgi:hypothetical protein
LLTHREATDDQVLQDAMQIGDGEFFGFRKMSVTRDVAEEVDPAERGVDSPEEFFNGDRVRNIRVTRDRTTPHRPDPLASRLRAGEIAID